MPLDRRAKRGYNRYTTLRNTTAMEEKENLSPTRQRTLAAIHTAFYELLRKMPFEKITIRNICDEAKVSKFTFYNYYCDKYELAEALEEEFIGGLCDIIEGPELSEAGNSLRSKNVWNYITDHAEEYRALTTLTLNGVNFNQYLLERLQKLTQKQIADGVPISHVMVAKINDDRVFATFVSSIIAAFVAAFTFCKELKIHSEHKFFVFSCKNIFLHVFLSFLRF